MSQERGSLGDVRGFREVQAALTNGARLPVSRRDFSENAWFIRPMEIEA